MKTSTFALLAFAVTMFPAIAANSSTDAQLVFGKKAKTYEMNISGMT